MSKWTHEIRDPIHTFVHLDSDERRVVDSRPVQRLRHIHQLGLANLVYPAATHKRFEHSLGVMELAGRIFDVITNPEHCRFPSVSEMVPRGDKLAYWRRVLRMAALTHDVGHLPFSHVAEHTLLPTGWNHERLTIEIIRSPSMMHIWNDMQPPLKWQDIAKLAVGVKEWTAAVAQDPALAECGMHNDWETILSEVITGNAFGADRMDYLLRDSFHAGVVYGHVDHFRLVDTLRILPKSYDQQSNEPALGVEGGGLRSAEALLLARYFMHSQVYFHPVCKIYEEHLKDFLVTWLADHSPSGRFPTTVSEHLDITDNEITTGLLKAARDNQHRGHDPAERIVGRHHFRLLYERGASDLGGRSKSCEQLFEAASKKFGPEKVRRTFKEPKADETNFPVLNKNGDIVSSRASSEVLQHLPTARFDYVFIDGSGKDDATQWLQDYLKSFAQAQESEETDGSAEA